MGRAAHWQAGGRPGACYFCDCNAPYGRIIIHFACDVWFHFVYHSRDVIPIPGCGWPLPRSLLQSACAGLKFAGSSARSGRFETG